MTHKMADQYRRDVSENDVANYEDLRLQLESLNDLRKDINRRLKTLVEYKLSLSQLSENQSILTVEDKKSSIKKLEESIQQKFKHLEKLNQAIKDVKEQLRLWEEYFNQRPTNNTALLL